MHTNGKPGLAADFEFHKLYEDFADTDFHSVVSQIFDSDDYVGATLRAIFQIRMKAKDFLNVEPWFVTTSTAPPSSLDKNDYRQQMFENATANRDFTIETLDGPIETVRYLLYLTVDEIRVLVNEDPSIRAVTANFRKQIVQEMINYALKGSFGLIDASPTIIDEFIDCIRFYRPHGFWQLIRYISTKLSDKVVENWNTMSLRDLLNYLRLSIHHQFRELSAKTILIIANSHYNKFVRDYNSNSTGERLEMYRALKESTIATEGNVIEKIKSVFNTGRRTRRILRYNTFECPV